MKTWACWKGQRKQVKNKCFLIPCPYIGFQQNVQIGDGFSQPKISGLMACLSTPNIQIRCRSSNFIYVEVSLYHRLGWVLLDHSGQSFCIPWFCLQECFVKFCIYVHEENLLLSFFAGSLCDFGFRETGATSYFNFA